MLAMLSCIIQSKEHPKNVQSPGDLLFKIWNLPQQRTFNKNPKPPQLLNGR